MSKFKYFHCGGKERTLFSFYFILLKCIVLFYIFVTEDEVIGHFRMKGIILGHKV